MLFKQSFQDFVLFFFFCDRRNEREIKEAPQHLEELSVFLNCGSFCADLGQDASRDVITAHIQPKPSSVHRHQT